MSVRNLVRVVSAVAAALIFTTAGMAGPVFLTGHDPDFHAQDDAGARRLLMAGVKFARHGSTKPLLWVESRIPVPGGHRVGKNGLLAIGMVENVDFVQMNGNQLAALSAAQWAAFSTTYSAIGVASDFGGILTQAELDQLISHKDAIADFVNQGGGVLAMSECGTGVAPCLTSSGAFSFLPIAIVSTGNASPPYVVTPYGFATFQLLASDVNSPSHSHFNGDFGLNVVSSSQPTGQIMTLAGEVTITGHGFLTANAGPDQTIDGGPATNVTLDGSGSSSDPGGEPLQYHWAEGSTTLANTTQPTAAVILGPGIHNITLTIINSRGETAADDVVITIRNTAPPVITCPSSITTTTEPGVCHRHVTYATPSATSGVGPVSVTCDTPSGTAFPGGITPVKCTATDINGNTSSCTFTVQVNDAEVPVVLPPSFAAVSADAACHASVPAAIAGSTFSDNCTADHDLVVSQAPAAGAPVSIGTTTIVVSATDESGNTGSATTAFTVKDATAPVISDVTASPSYLWPVNHKLIPISITATATDTCMQQPPACRIVSITSNEPLNGVGDGNTSADWSQTGALSLLLRAERSGAASDRIYTIGVSCTDAAGNTATRSVTVTVPHDQR